MVSEIRKVLCPTDGSRASQNAIDFAVAMGKQFPGLAVEFLHVSRAEASPEEARYLGVELVEASLAQEYAELAYANERSKEAGLSDFKCVRIFAHRNIAAAIIHHAEKGKFDHIIMGSTGRTGVTRILLGSVAKEVVGTAHCPVTVVR
jgi:nucleotide-binding universal stress UspA family protein